MTNKTENLLTAIWSRHAGQAAFWRALCLVQLALTGLALLLCARLLNRPREVVRIGCDGIPQLFRLDVDQYTEHQRARDAGVRPALDRSLRPARQGASRAPSARPASCRSRRRPACCSRQRGSPSGIPPAPPPARLGRGRPALVGWAAVAAAAARFVLVHRRGPDPQEEHMESRLPPYPFDPSKEALVIGEQHAQEGEQVEDPRWLVLPFEGLYGNTICLGATGSAKTSSLAYPLTMQLIRIHANDPERKLGGLIMDPKGNYAHFVRGQMAAAGRADDFFEVALDGEVYTNVLERPDLNAPALAGHFFDAIKNYQGEGHHDPFWRQEALDLATQAIRTIRLITGREPTIRKIYRVGTSYDSFEPWIKEAQHLAAKPRERVKAGKPEPGDHELIEEVESGRGRPRSVLAALSLRVRNEAKTVAGHGSCAPSGILLGEARDPSLLCRRRSARSGGFHGATQSVSRGCWARRACEGRSDIANRPSPRLAPTMVSLRDRAVRDCAGRSAGHLVARAPRGIGQRRAPSFPTAQGEPAVNPADPQCVPVDHAERPRNPEATRLAEATATAVAWLGELLDLVCRGNPEHHRSVHPHRC